MSSLHPGQPVRVLRAVPRISVSTYAITSKYTEYQFKIFASKNVAPWRLLKKIILLNRFLRIQKERHQEKYTVISNCCKALLSASLDFARFLVFSMQALEDRVEGRAPRALQLLALFQEALHDLGKHAERERLRRRLR